MVANVVRLDDHRPIPPTPKQDTQKSQYELYALPFFNRKKRCTWDVKPSGSYSVDYEIGRQFAYDFLKSCDESVGWTTLLGQIVGDMICAGTSEQWPDGTPRVNGIVVGFTRTIGQALTLVSRLD